MNRRPASRSRSRSQNRSRRPARKPTSRKPAFQLTPAIPEEQFDFADATKVGLVFWCRKCAQVVDPERKGKKFVCPQCGESQIVFGTQKSIDAFSSHQKDHYSR